MSILPNRLILSCSDMDAGTLGLLLDYDVVLSPPVLSAVIAHVSRLREVGHVEYCTNLHLFIFSRPTLALSRVVHRSSF